MISVSYRLYQGESNNFSQNPGSANRAWPVRRVNLISGKGKHININKFGGSSRDWVGGSQIFVYGFFGILPSEGKTHKHNHQKIQGQSPENPGTIPWDYCLCHIMCFLLRCFPPTPSWTGPIEEKCSERWERRVIRQACDLLSQQGLPWQTSISWSPVHVHSACIPANLILSKYFWALSRKSCKSPRSSYWKMLRLNSFQGRAALGKGTLTSTDRLWILFGALAGISGKSPGALTEYNCYRTMLVTNLAKVGYSMWIQRLVVSDTQNLLLKKKFFWNNHSRKSTNSHHRIPWKSPSFLEILRAQHPSIKKKKAKRVSGNWVSG